MFAAETLNQLLAAGGRESVPRAAGRSAHRHLVLHLPLADLHHRPLPRACHAGASPSPTSRPLWRCFRTSWPDPSSATRPSRRNWPFASIPCRGSPPGSRIFMLGFAKKILLANPAGHVADAVFNAAQPAAARCVVGRAGLRVSDLLRLLRLLGHGGGSGPDAGLRVPEELRRTLPVPRALPISGAAGTSRFRACCAITSTSRWAATARGPTRTYVNLAVVMLLGGLWHGAKWNFVVWGAYHGLLLVWERWRSKTSLYGQLPRIAPWASPSCWCSSLGCSSGRTI